MNSSISHGPVFSEVQRVTQWWIWLLVAALEAFVIWMFITQVVRGHPVGNNPAPDSAVWLILFVVGLGVPLLVYSVRLTTEILADRLIIRFSPFYRRTIYFRDIAKTSPCTYRPIIQYGGWGIRYGINSGWCYTLYGNRGVQLELSNGKTILVGSQHPEEVVAAISRAMSRR